MESVEPKGKPDGGDGPASVADGPAERPPTPLAACISMTVSSPIRTLNGI